MLTCSDCGDTTNRRRPKHWRETDQGTFCQACLPWSLRDPVIGPKGVACAREWGPIVGSEEGKVGVVLGTGPSLLRMREHIRAAEEDPRYFLIGVNWAFMIANCDYGLWLDHDRLIGKSESFEGKTYIFSPDCYAGAKATFAFAPNRQEPHDWPGLYKLYPPDAWRARRVERSTYQGCAFTGSSAHAAVHVAFTLGAENVITWGCDCGVDEMGREYFYDIDGGKDPNQKKFEAFRDGWWGTRNMWPGSVFRAWGKTISTPMPEAQSGKAKV